MIGYILTAATAAVWLIAVFPILASALPGYNFAVASASAVTNDCSSIHTVVPGESCWFIATSRGLTLNQLIALNPGISCTVIYPGDRICVKRSTPSTGSIPISRQDGTCHVAVAQGVGQTCSIIAKQYRLTITQLLSVNPGLDCNRSLSAGQRVCVSRGTLSPVKITKTSSIITSTPTATRITQPAMPSQTTVVIPPTPGTPSCGRLPVSVGYATSWSIWRPCMKVAPEDIDASAYTHIHFSFAIVDANHRLALSNEDDRTFLRRLVLHIRARYPGVKVVIAVGGWSFNDPGPTQLRFSTMASTAANRKTFITSTLGLLKEFGANGIDIDWEYPSSPERGGNSNDANNLVALVREMRAAFGTLYSLSAAVPAGSGFYFTGFKLAEMAQSLDYMY